jgi:hypothetical protein
MSRAWIGCLYCIVVLVGCSGGTDKAKASRPKTALANGVVTYNGQPLDGALIVFVPEVNEGTSAAAVSNSQGKFTAMAFSPEQGAVPGKYTVTVSKMLEPTAEQPDEAGHDAPPPKVVKPKSLIPIKYSQPKTSTLIVVVPAEGTESLKLELKD